MTPLQEGTCVTIIHGEARGCRGTINGHWYSKPNFYYRITLDKPLCVSVGLGYRTTYALNCPEDEFTVISPLLLLAEAADDSPSGSPGP